MACPRCDGAQASSLWGSQASRLRVVIRGRQDARQSYSQDGCASEISRFSTEPDEF